MKILLVSNMYPSEELPYSGVFVKAQLDHFKKKHSDEIAVKIFFMRQIITSKFKSLWKYLMAYVRFIPHLFQKYDVIHVHYFGFLAPLAAVYGFFHPSTKLIVTFHGSDINKDMTSSGKKNSLFRSLIRKFHKIIAVGDALHEPLKEKLGVEPDLTLCAGVDKEIFYHTSGEPKEYDFLVVGSFLEVKGIDVVLDALKKAKNRSMKFCFIGNGPLEKEILKIKEYASVEIKNNLTQNELRSYYSRSRFLLFSSKNDAFGLVVTESMYSGTPAIVSSSGGAQDQVIHGLNGFVYENNSSTKLASLMDSLMQISDHDYDQMVTRAASSNSQHSLQNVCSRLKLLYEESQEDIIKELTLEKV